jgi:hypothetical protein
VPAMSPAGTVDMVSLRGVSAYSSDVQGSAAINVTVEPVRSLEVRVKKAPEQVIAGGKAEYEFEVTNLGNEELTLTMDITGVNGSWVKLPPALRIAIGGTVTANLTIEPDGSALGEYVITVHFANRDVNASASVDLTVLAPADPVPGGDTMDGDGTDIRTEGVPLWGLLALVGLVIAVLTMVGLIARTRSSKKGGQ